MALVSQCLCFRYTLAGAAAGLMLLNAVTLMVGCWPTDPDQDRDERIATATAAATATARARAKGGGRGRGVKASDPERTLLLPDSGDGAEQGFSVNADFGPPSSGESAEVVPKAALLSSSSTRVAQQDADERATAEQKAKASRERGYGTFKLLELARPHKSWLYAGCVILLIRLPFSLSIPHWVAETIGALIDKQWSVATWNIIYLCICGTCDSILDFWCVYIFGLAQQKIIRSLRLDLFAAILRQDIGFFDTTKTGEITSRLTADTAEMANDLTWVFRFTIEAIVRIGGIIGYMFVRSWRLGFLAMAVIPVTAVINHFYARWMRTNQEKVQTALAEANTVAEEVIASIRTIFSFAMEQGEHTRYHRRIQRYYILVVQQVYIQGIYYMVCNTFL
jgi:ABC-type bacteriocin/lantibiotic exporter with double-glycine peptidase domain